MAFIHGRNSRLLLGALLFHGYLRSFEHGDESEMADVTTYGNEGHRFIPGLEQGSLTLDGVLDNVATAGSQDATLDAALGSSSAAVITAAVAGLARGSRVYMIEARETNYAVSSPIGEAVTFNASWTSEGQVDHGVTLTDSTESTTGSAGSVDSTSVDNGASSANGLAASVHVTANTRNGSTTFIVQHSSDNSTFVDLLTFTVVGAGVTTAEKKATTGTVNRYLRLRTTRAGSTGSITYAVAAARR